MLTVHKFEVLPEFVLSLPLNARVLKIMIQHGTPYMWVQLDTNEPSIYIWKFKAFGTGHAIPQDVDCVYIDSFMVEDGAFVFHLYYTRA